MKNKNKPYQYDLDFVDIQNAKPCGGCGEGMDKLKVGSYVCPYCGGESTTYGGFYPRETLSR